MCVCSSTHLGLWLSFLVDFLADIDECTRPDTCSQECSNRRGTFLCVCTDGYLLEPDGKTCKVTGMVAVLKHLVSIRIRVVATMFSLKWTCRAKRARNQCPYICPLCPGPNFIELLRRITCCKLLTNQKTAYHQPERTGTVLIRTTISLGDS